MSTLSAPTANNDTSTQDAEASNLPDAPEAEQVPLSKKALKKARKTAHIQERKLERRAREKEARKEKKRKRAERVAAGEVVSEDEHAHKRPKNASGPRTPFNARVVVDLGFDDKMNEKEISSLISQLAYCYSANRHSSTPFTSILFTSLNGRTKGRLDGMNDAGYKRWSSTEWWEEDYDRLWLNETNSADASSPDATHAGRSVAESPRTRALKSSVVYLTADSPDVLEELVEGEVYIIGGLCDHNRYKNICLKRAQASGIRTAQLPIGRYLSNLPTRKVLTVNQVFEILVKCIETRDWEAAFYSVIPKRKFQGAESQGSNGSEGNDTLGADAAHDDAPVDVDDTPAGLECTGSGSIE